MELNPSNQKRARRRDLPAPWHFKQRESWSSGEGSESLLYRRPRQPSRPQASRSSGGAGRRRVSRWHQRSSHPRPPPRRPAAPAAPPSASPPPPETPCSLSFFRSCAAPSSCRALRLPGHETQGTASDWGCARTPKARDARSLLSARLTAGTEYLTAYKLLENILDAFPFCSGFALLFLCAIPHLALRFLASLQDPSRKVMEMEEKTDGEKPAEVTQADEAHTGFPIPVNISAAGLEVLLVSLRNSCSSSLLGALLASSPFGLRQRSRGSLFSPLSASTKQPLSPWFSTASKRASNFIPVQQNT